jgi:ABC-type uncharacterized transport system permease subunit
MQLLSLILTLLAFAGGLFIPISQLPGAVQAIAKWTPEYGLNQLTIFKGGGYRSGDGLRAAVG